MSVALLLHGGLYYIGLAGMLVLFFIGLKNINLSLHAIFVKALTSSFSANPRWRASSTPR